MGAEECRWINIETKPKKRKAEGSDSWANDTADTWLDNDVGWKINTSEQCLSHQNVVNRLGKDVQPWRVRPSGQTKWWSAIGISYFQGATGIKQWRIYKTGSPPKQPTRKSMNFVIQCPYQPASRLPIGSRRVLHIRQLHDPIPITANFLTFTTYQVRKHLRMAANLMIISLKLK